MNKVEILAKGRAENKNKDVYEQEVLKQVSKIVVLVQMILAAICFATQILVGKDINWGLWALVFKRNMASFWVKYIKLRRNHELMMAILYTILVSVMSGYYVYNLISFSTTV